MSGRSSAVGEILAGGGGRSNPISNPHPNSLSTSQTYYQNETCPRHQLLEEFIRFIPQLRDLNGIRVIPFLQVC